MKHIDLDQVLPCLPIVKMAIKHQKQDLTESVTAVYFAMRVGEKFVLILLDAKGAFIPLTFDTGAWEVKTITIRMSSCQRQQRRR